MDKKQLEIIDNNRDHLPYVVSVKLANKEGVERVEHYPMLQLYEIEELWGNYSDRVVEFKMVSLL